MRHTEQSAAMQQTLCTRMSLSGWFCMAQQPVYPSVRLSLQKEVNIIFARVRNQLMGLYLNQFGDFWKLKSSCRKFVNHLHANPESNVPGTVAFGNDATPPSKTAFSDHIIFKCIAVLRVAEKRYITYTECCLSNNFKNMDKLHF